MLFCVTIWKSIRKREQPYTFLGRKLDQIPSRLPRVTERFAAYAGAQPANAVGFAPCHAKALDAQSIEPERALGLLEKSIASNSGDDGGAL